MLELVFALCMLSVFGKLFVIGMKATWSITKLIFTIVFLPIVLIGMVLGGLIYVAFLIVILMGIVMWIMPKW